MLLSQFDAAALFCDEHLTSPAFANSGNNSAAITAFQRAIEQAYQEGLQHGAAAATARQDSSILTPASSTAPPTDPRPGQADMSPNPPSSTRTDDGSAWLSEHGQERLLAGSPAGIDDPVERQYQLNRLRNVTPSATPDRRPPDPPPSPPASDVEFDFTEFAD